jgi:hypothetical protein
MPGHYDVATKHNESTQNLNTLNASQLICVVYYQFIGHLSAFRFFTFYYTSFFSSLFIIRSLPADNISKIGWNNHPQPKMKNKI